MALITLSELKTFLSISGTDQDTILQIYVDSANAFIINYLNRDIEETAYTDEVYDGPGTPALVLRQYPLISVEEVLVNGEAETESTDVTDTEGYYIKSYDNGILYNRAFWDRGRGIIQVSYTAGYTTIPGDLKHASLAVAGYFRNMGNKTGVRSESLGSYSYSIANELAAMGSDLTIPDVVVKNILDRYRARYIGGVY